MENIHDGCCRFCGQVVQYDDDILKLADGNPDIAAKLVCDCKEAQIFAVKHQNIINGVGKVDEIAGKASANPLPDETVHFLHRAVTHLVYRRMTKITVQVSGTEKVTLALTAKGIKVTREEKSTQNLEVEMLVQGRDMHGQKIKGRLGGCGWAQFPQPAIDVIICMAQS